MSRFCLTLKYNFWIILWIFILSKIYLVNSIEIAPPPIGKVLKEGDCKKAVLGEIVFQDHVQRPAIPLLSRNATATWHGDYRIYCLMATPQTQQSTDAEVVVKEGGVNHTFVTIEIHSKRNEGLDYNIQVFGKKIL